MSGTSRADEPVSSSGLRFRGQLKIPRLRRLAIALTLLPLVVSAITLVVRVDDYYPMADRALIELRTRDVGPHMPLSGLYSRDGWDHPGPAQFIALALPYRLSGSSSIGVGLGALVINGLSIVGMAVIALRRGGESLLLCTLIGCAILLRALGADFVQDPWNCFLPVLPFGLMLFLTWSLTCGDKWALPFATGLASFLAQTHVGYVALAFPLLAWGAVGLMTSTRRAIKDEHARRHIQWDELAQPALLAFAVFAVMWLPPLVGEVRNSPGNLRRTYDWFRSADEGVHSIKEGYRVVIGQFTWPPEWVAGARPENLLTAEPALLYAAHPPMLLLPFGAAALYAFTRRSLGDARRLVITVGLAVILGILAVARTVGTMYDYRLRWAAMPAMAASVATAWISWIWASRRSKRIETRSLVPLSVATLVVLGLVNAVGAARASIPKEADAKVMAALTPAALAALPRAEGAVVLRPTSPSATFYAQGLLLQLEQRAVPARIAGDARVYGSHRVSRTEQVRATLTIASDHGFDEIAARPGTARLVAYWGVQSPQARAALIRRQAEQNAALDALYESGALEAEDLIYRKAKIPGLPHTEAISPAVGVFLER